MCGVCVVVDTDIYSCFSNFMQLHLFLFLLISSEMQQWTSVQLIMGISATFKIDVNQLTYKQPCIYSKVVIIVCLMLVVTTAIS